MKHMHYSDTVIEQLLQEHSHALGNDIAKYKNHVYRVFLNCILIDNKEENKEKYAIAAVFHDIGIWTDHTIDYLYPSIAQARNYLIQHNLEHLADEISLMIYWHHKIRKYESTYRTTVETFRKADWIDVSLGLKKSVAPPAKSASHV